MTSLTRRALALGGALALTSAVSRPVSAETGHLLRDHEGGRQRSHSQFSERGSAASTLISREGNSFLELDTLLDAEPGVYGVMVVDQQGLLRYSRNARLPFISASLYKLLLAAEILRQIETGILAFDDTFRLESQYFIESQMPDGAYDYDAIESEISLLDALWATICVSSNVAAIGMLEMTSPAQMNTLAQQLGMGSTSFAADLEQLAFWPPVSAESDTQLLESIALIEQASWDWQVNLTSPADMTLFMHAIMNGTLVSPFVSGELLRLLFDQQINDRIPALLPAKTRTAHKTGNLISIVHDAGAMLTSKGPVLLSMLSQGVPDDQRATRLLQTIAAMVFAEFEQA